MESRTLRYFLAIVDHGGMTRAAEALHVAQPSVSQAIHALERELGTELFHRTSRGLVLTSAGNAAVAPARRVVRDLAQVQTAVQPVLGLRDGRLDLVVQQLLSGLGAELVGEFARRHPEVAVRMVEPARPHHVGAAVRSGDVELALCTLPVPDGDGLLSEELLCRNLFVALPRTTEAEHEGVPIDPGELIDTPFITSPPGSAWRKLLMQVMAPTGRIPHAPFEITTQGALFPLITAGAGAAIVTPELTGPAHRRGAVVRPLRTTAELRLGALRRPGQVSPAARELLNVYQEWAAQRGNQHPHLA